MKQALVALGAVMLVGATGPGERIVTGDALVPVTIKGRAARLRIDPAAPGLPILTPARAAALKLKGGGLLAFGVAYRIGPERFHGRTQSVKFGWDGGKAGKRRVGWMSRDYAAPIDGTIGPSGVPDPVVRFQLHPERPGEVPLVLPLRIESGLGGALFGSWFTLDAMMRVGDTPILVRLDPHHARTLATASAAVALAKTHGGVMTAAIGRQEIAFGVERPYRIMKLARPLVLGGISLVELGVRATDADVAGRIAEEGAVVAEPDPDEVVVTAKARKPRPGLLLLGADALAGCSSIVFDKPAKEVRLSCG